MYNKGAVMRVLHMFNECIDVQRHTLAQKHVAVSQLYKGRALVRTAYTCTEHHRRRAPSVQEIHDGVQHHVQAHYHVVPLYAQSVQAERGYARIHAWLTVARSHKRPSRHAHAQTCKLRSREADTPCSV